MSELSQLRGAIFDLTEQIRELNEALNRPQHRLGLQVDRLANLLHIIEQIPKEIVMKMDGETKDVLENHSHHVAELMG
jgi:hypothetical protein